MTSQSFLTSSANAATSFGLVIEFEKASENPSRVFSALTKLIEACKTVDGYLIQSIPIEVEPVLLLEDVQQGSIRVWLKNAFKLPDNLPTNNIDLNLLSKYLAKAKYFIIDFSNGRTEVTNVGLTDTQFRINELLHEVNPTRDMPVYTDISKKNLLNSCKEFQEAVKPLSSQDKAKMILPDGQETTFNLVFDFSPDSIEKILTVQTIKNTSTMILKIKKPDYLGSSKWEFYQDKVIEVKVSDFEWITRFRRREFPLAPGDSIKATVEVTSNYDADNNLVSTKYEIQEVLSVVPGSSPTSPTLFDLGE
ncbi:MULTISPECIES: hypothetical protein [Leptolyngbya]|uniref:hypothetical protein n=1 Tax=Leptolyngbya TaxID=47251 RepID=UPI001681EC82|nr:MULTISPECIES: hypothetical protein [unclassified Leptolyngbya]MBD1856457.1 hypothetical protein [Leptolyngbya sp. FACHB-1624]MBN8564125.1 hypothetical protein [Leptolyngbya sp. UWPOB_LEPTO1]